MNPRITALARGSHVVGCVFVEKHAIRFGGEFVSSQRVRAPAGAARSRSGSFVSCQLSGPAKARLGDFSSVYFIIHEMNYVVTE